MIAIVGFASVSNCPKCRADVATAPCRLVGASARMREHLERKCVCGHWWREQCADAASGVVAADQTMEEMLSAAEAEVERLGIDLFAVESSPHRIPTPPPCPPNCPQCLSRGADGEYSRSRGAFRS